MSGQPAGGTRITQAAAAWLPRLLGGRLSREARRTSVATVLLSGSTFVSNLVITLLLTRLVGPHEYGIFAFALAAAGFLGVPAVLGMVPLLIRNVASYRVRGRWGELHGLLRRAGQSVLASSLVVVAGAAAFGLVLRGPRPEVLPAYWVALLLVPLTALTTIRQATIQGFDRVVLARVPETLVQPGLFVLLLVIWSMSGTLTGTVAVALQLLAAGAAFVLGLVLLRRVVPDDVTAAEPVYRTREWARSMVPLLLLTGVNTLNQQVDVLLLGALDGAAAAGVYSVAFRVAGVVSFFLVAATYPLSPVVARLWTTGDREQLQRVVTVSARLVFTGALAVAVALVLLRAPVLGFFGPEFVAGQTALVVLVAGQLVNAATGSVGLVLMMTGHEADVTWAVGTGAVLGLVLDLLLIPPFGLAGAAVATATAVAASNLLLLMRLRRRTGLWAAALGRRGV